MSSVQQEYFIDGHCHLADCHNVDEIIAHSRHLGIGGFVLGGTCPQDWQRQLQLQAAHPDQIYPVMGVHPWQALCTAEQQLTSALAQLETMACAAVAVGEIGLDRSSTALKAVFKTQEWLMAQQLALAARLNLPVVLHVVKAHNEVLVMLQHHHRHHPGHSERGVVHGFYGSVELARSYLNLGYLLGLGDAALRRPAPKLWQFLPDDGFMIESDAPQPWHNYDAPQGAQVMAAGKPLTAPGIIVAIAASVAIVRKTSADTLLTHCSDNIRRVFRLPMG